MLVTGFSWWLRNRSHRKRDKLFFLFGSHCYGDFLRLFHYLFSGCCVLVRENNLFLSLPLLNVESCCGCMHFGRESNVMWRGQKWHLAVLPFDHSTRSRLSRSLLGRHFSSLLSLLSKNATILVVGCDAYACRVHSIAIQISLPQPCTAYERKRIFVYTVYPT